MLSTEGSNPMLDLYAILFTSLVMLLVIVRALQADRAQPWFQAVRRQDTPPKADRLSTQRRG
jgi:hypothetical protein